mmetsp:Transcript_114461/g.334652  ORF Transcript_114461/g.334652 Transcript_114461/m.334652 type:complete len:223 (-) Transcript_114461:135-803(-)
MGARVVGRRARHKVPVRRTRRAECDHEQECGELPRLPALQHPLPLQRMREGGHPGGRQEGHLRLRQAPRPPELDCVAAALRARGRGDLPPRPAGLEPPDRPALPGRRAAAGAPDLRPRGGGRRRAAGQPLLRVRLLLLRGGARGQERGRAWPEAARPDLPARRVADHAAGHRRHGPCRDGHSCGGAPARLPQAGRGGSLSGDRCRTPWGGLLSGSGLQWQRG